jgi:LysM repeat protein
LAINIGNICLKSDICSWFYTLHTLKQKEMKKLFSLLLALPLVAVAQNGSSMLKAAGSGADLYLNHTVAAKENFYSIGRLYNISPKDMAPYNNLTLEKGVSIGQAIKIPLKAGNFLQADNAVGADEVAVPVFHTVAAKQTLYNISTTYNKVSIANLKAWNKLPADAVSPEQNIIVGWLKVKKEQSSLAQMMAPEADNPAYQTPPVVVKEPAPEPVAEASVKAPKAPEKPVVETPKPTKPIVKVEEKKPEPKPVLKKEEVVAAPVTKPAKAVEPINTTTIYGEDEPSVAKDFKGGFFKGMFDGQAGFAEEGSAGVFKSTSGWEDGKYYCLHNKAEKNTIVKITNKTTGKFIYARVLDVMPDLKQNKNLVARISNSAASILGADANNFDCKIEY